MLIIMWIMENSTFIQCEMMKNNKLRLNGLEICFVF